jgi:hypothetical protein
LIISEVGTSWNTKKEKWRERIGKIGKAKKVKT